MVEDKSQIGTSGKCINNLKCFVWPHRGTLEYVNTEIYE